MPIRRRIADLAALLFATGATLFGLMWLVWILWTTVIQGAAALSPALVTQMTPPPGASGGLLNAFYGSAVMVLLALQNWLLSAVKRSGAVSPAMRARPSRIPVTMPLSADL